MPRLLSIFLILGLLAPSLGFTSTSPDPTTLSQAHDNLLPTYFFTDEQGHLLAIFPFSEDLFIWLYFPSLTFTNQISQTPAKILTYSYDPSGIRLTSTTKDLNTLQTSTTTYPSIYYNTDGSKVIEHIFANETPVLTLETTGATTQSFWNFQDHLNSTVLVSDISGGLFERVEYYAFGSILRNPGPHKEQRKYTGHEYDPQTPTNYSYAKARYLDTKFGRFLSQDPAFRLLGDPDFENEYNLSLENFLADPQLLNSYSYARNNPLAFTDPDGECVEPASFAVCAGIAYALTQLALSLYDLYNTIQAYNNPNLSGTEKALTTSFFFAGIADPIGGGYTGALKTGGNTAKNTGEKFLYRSIKEGPNGLPLLEDSARGLGVRFSRDITPGSSGMVHPGTGGLSVVPNDPRNLHPSFKPPEFGGIGKDPVWCIKCSALPRGINYVPDSATHGTLQPSTSMFKAEFNKLIQSTQGLWKKL